MSYLKRQYFRRFLRPINKLKLSPDQVGRTVVVGLFWGLTASVGLQVIGVSLCWVVMRWLDRPFNLPIALLLTGVTNPLTIAPIYSLYFVVGCAALPSCHPGVGSVETIVARLNEEGLWDVLADSWQFFAITYGGSLPFAIAGSVAGLYFGRWIGHVLSHRRKRRADALARSRRADRHEPAPGA